ncbi:MAG: hypothetical protein Q4A60_06600 [Pasteurellaceae bacterium]|nr:hypothetical protein [Pasteurellaceae bacterium]
MKVKCAACGALSSLDSLIANDAASRAIYAALSVNGELGTALIGYLGLFRPAKSSLSFDRVATLLNELVPMIQASEIQRDGKAYPAPAEAWIYAINAMLANRAGLKLPMKSHGYLLEIIAGWQPQTASGAMAVVNQVWQQNSEQQEPSKTFGALQKAKKWASGG